MAIVYSTCFECGARYSGRAGHCKGGIHPGCHRTFSSDSSFNAHLVSKVTAGCLDPETVTTKDGRRLLFWNETRQLWQGEPRPDHLNHQAESDIPQ